MYRRVVVAGLLIGWSAKVRAQETTMLIPSDREASAQVATIVASARASGLPTDPIVGKVNYGVSVIHAKPEMIVSAASNVARRLELAREALAPNPTHADIVSGADALGAKATVDALRAVRKASGSRPVATALAVLTQLLLTNVPLPKAQEIVTDLVRRGATPAQLVALGNDVNADVATGTQALAAADVRARGLMAILAAPGHGLAGDEVTAPLPGSFTGTGTSKPPNPPKRP